MPTDEQIERCRRTYAAYSDSELINTMHSYIESSPDHVAAKQMFYERQHQRSEDNQNKLLEEIRKPHWSITPSFVLLVVSIILSAAALIVAYAALPQDQKPIPPTPQAGKAQQPAVSSSQSSTDKATK